MSYYRFILFISHRAFWAFEKICGYTDLLDGAVQDAEEDKMSPIFDFVITDVFESLLCPSDNLILLQSRDRKDFDPKSSKLSAKFSSLPILWF